MEGRGGKRENAAGFRPHPRLERGVGRRAADQHNVIALRQLREVGLTAEAARKRVAIGRWRQVHAGVYAVSHAKLTREGHWMAAVLACGPGAVLSHRSAAALWGLRRDNRATSDVTSKRRRGRSRTGITAHQGHLLAREVETIDGIPCTSLARTLLDLAEVVDRRGLERAIDRAEQLRLLDMHAVNDVLERANGRRGAPLLRSVLAEHYAASTLTASELEERFLLICLTAAVSAPQVNAWIALEHNTGYRADFLWRTQRLIVEVDGHATHGTRQAFERDRHRDQRLTLAGYRVVRFTWRQITEEPERVAETLRALLLD
ncbi:MAG: endonuclease domain-containing protein [Actinomycetota bacterium]|nr:endonuclease domain-containing protein [Actinomycetota bacterium]